MTDRQTPQSKFRFDIDWEVGRGVGLVSYAGPWSNSNCELIRGRLSFTEVSRGGDMMAITSERLQITLGC